MSAESVRFTNADVSKTLLSIPKTAEIAAQWLSAIVESSDDAIISKDLDGIIESWNRGATMLFGYTEQEVIGKPVTILIPPDRQNEEPEILSRIRQGERIDHYETVRQRKNGSLVDISLTVSPILSQDGTIIGASKIARDITEQKERERYREMLLAEMRHRVKNSLALAASIATQSFHSATSEERETFVSRLKTLGDAHEILSRQTWESASLEQIVARAVEPHQQGERQIAISGPDTIIDSRKAIALSLALHELATNAVKYGALSQPGGTVTVEWQPLDDEPDVIGLRWRERDGPIVEQPKQPGFGSRLIRHGLASDFEAVDLEFPPEGAVCNLTFFRTVATDGRHE